jgi:hypothetical protein
MSGAVFKVQRHRPLGRLAEKERSCARSRGDSTPKPQKILASPFVHNLIERLAITMETRLPIEVLPASRIRRSRGSRHHIHN